MPAEEERNDSQQAHHDIVKLSLQVDADEASAEQDSLRAALGSEASDELGLIKLPDGFVLSVVMPVFNEQETIETVIQRVLATMLPIELVVIDDGSSDGTREVLADLKLESLATERHPRSSLEIRLHKQNQGKGAALRTGFAIVTGDVVVIQDADTEYDPQDFYTLLPPILNGEADVVYGSRFQSESSSTSPGWHRFGNQMITRTSNLFTRQKFTDVETCYKMFRRSFLQQISDTLQERGFGIELEMTAKLARLKGIRFCEVPITYRKRSYAEGKKIGWKDAVWALWCILRY